MATGTANDYTAQTPAIWAADLFAEAENLTFFNNWEGPEGSGMPIIRKDDLTKEAGDTIKVDIVMALVGAGQSGDLTSLEGNEEELRFRQMSFSPEEKSHAVAWTGKAARRINHDMRTTARNQLAKWLAGKLDNLVFNEMSGGSGGSTIPDANTWAAGTATTRATVADTSGGGKLTIATLQELRAYAKSQLKIEPVMTVDGEEYYILVAHPYALLELKRDDTSWSQAQRDARVRSDNNPVFTGAAGMIDGVILKESNRVNTSSNGTISVADNILLGSQAMVRGYAMYPTWVEEDFDYQRKAGIATIVDVGQKITAYDLTQAGGAADSAKTWIGGMVVWTAAVAPGQP